VGMWASLHASITFTTIFHGAFSSSFVATLKSGFAASLDVSS